MRDDYSTPAITYLLKKSKSSSTAGAGAGDCGAFACPANACGINYCGGNACAGNACGVQLCPVDLCPVDGCAIDFFATSQGKETLGLLPEQVANIGKLDAKLLEAIASAPDSYKSFSLSAETIEKAQKSKSLDVLTKSDIDKLLADVKKASRYIEQKMKSASGLPEPK